MVPETVTWIDPDGNQFPLTDQNPYYIPAPGLSGAYGLPMTMVSSVVPGFPGDREEYVQVNPGDVRLPLYVFGDDEAAVDNARRVILEATRPQRGYGILRHVANDGVTRDLFCREMGRLRDIVGRSPGLLRTSLMFRAADPYWYDTDFTIITLSPSGLLNFFGSPFLPIKLSAGGISSGFTVQNQGQADTWPQWVITGPGTNPVLTNSTTGEVLTIAITLTAGQVLTIDTNPDVLSVTREDGSNQWATISSASVLWALKTGANAIALAMTGTTTASSLQLMYKNRWEGV